MRKKFAIHPHTFPVRSLGDSCKIFSIIFDKIDKDSDGFVTEKELQDWIIYVQSKYINDDTQRQWTSSEVDGEKLTWDAYVKNTYGFIDDDIEGDEYAKFVTRDKTRWAKADLDNDGAMSQEEFRAFLHPEDAPHMHDVIIDVSTAIVLHISNTSCLVLLY